VPGAPGNALDELISTVHKVLLAPGGFVAIPCERGDVDQACNGASYVPWKRLSSIWS